MKKKARMRTPVDRNKHPKSFQETVLDHLKKERELVNSIKKDMRKIIVEEVTKQFDERKIMLEELYKHTNLLQKILMDKEKITREDLNKKYKELKKKNG